MRPTSFTLKLAYKVIALGNVPIHIDANLYSSDNKSLSAAANCLHFACRE